MLVALGPKVIARFCFDELTGNAYATASLSYASFENVADAEFTAHRPDIRRPPFVSERRIARDDEERGNA